MCHMVPVCHGGQLNIEMHASVRRASTALRRKRVEAVLTDCKVSADFPTSASAMSAAAKSKHNLSNPAIKRILAEVRELSAETSGEFEAHPLEVCCVHAPPSEPQPNHRPVPCHRTCSQSAPHDPPLVMLLPCVVWCLLRDTRVAGQPFRVALHDPRPARFALRQRAVPRPDFARLGLPIQAAQFHASHGPLRLPPPAAGFCHAAAAPESFGKHRRRRPAPSHGCRCASRTSCARGTQLYSTVPRTGMRLVRHIAPAGSTTACGRRRSLSGT
jgi:hypothetical protein